MDYRLLQPKWFLENTERFNFLHPTAQSQWWYFDFLLEDGSILIIAVVPRQWWPSKDVSDTTQASLFVTCRSPSGNIKKWLQAFPHNQLQHTKNRLSVNNLFTIEKTGKEYHVLIRLEGISADTQVQPLAQPFAASPYGRLPLWLLRMAGQKKRPLSYVSFVPHGSATIRLKGDGVDVDQNAMAYHEQGRLEGNLRDMKRDGWIWFHIFGGEWSIFGAEDTFIYIVKGKEVLVQRGIPIRSEKFTLSEKEYQHIDDRVLNAAVLDFSTPEISLNVIFEPSDEEDLIYWPSSNSNQLWSTRHVTAQVHIEHKEEVYDFSVPALLETCCCR